MLGSLGHCITCEMVTIWAWNAVIKWWNACIEDSLKRCWPEGMAVEDCRPAARLMVCCILNLVSSLGGIVSPLYASARSCSICPKASPSVHVHTVLLADIHKQKLANEGINFWCCLIYYKRIIARVIASLSPSRQTTAPFINIVTLNCVPVQVNKLLTCRRHGKKMDGNVCNKSAVLVL